MGRTLHYRIKDQKKFAPATKVEILKIQYEFNERYKWTCENFWLGDSQFKEDGFGGFVKTAGNEYNSFLVTSAISLMSIKFPKFTFTLHDEGEFLLFPLEIKNGKADIDYPDLISSMEYWKKTSAYNQHCIDETHEKLKELGIIINYTWEEKMGVRTIYHNSLTGEHKTKPEMQYKMVGITVEGDIWRPVKDFCRKIDPNDFKDHPEFQSCTISLDSGNPEMTSGTPSQIMAGFSGEYYGKVSEAEVALQSKKCQSNMFDVIGFLGTQGFLKEPLK